MPDILMWHPLTIRLDADPALISEMNERQRRVLARPVKLFPCKGGVEMAVRGRRRHFTSSEDLDRALASEQRSHETACDEALGEHTATGRYHADRAQFLGAARRAVAERAKRLWPQEQVA